MATLFTYEPFAPGFRLCFAAAVVLMIGRAAIYRSKAYAGERFDVAQEGAVILMLRRGAALVALGYFILYVAGWRGLAWSLIPLPVLLRWTGCVFALLIAPALAEWVYRHLGSNVSPSVVIRRDHALVTTGPYRWVRHPLYLVGILFHCGLILISGSWLLVLLLVVGVGAIVARTKQEEANLAAHFGAEYATYCRRTGRFFPKL